MKKPIIGVMGPGEAHELAQNDISNAKKLGNLIAENGWILLTGGMNSGVMQAANQGAKEKNGTTLGILPTDDKTNHFPNLDISIITNMKGGRNYINSFSSDIIIACGMGPGTASEVCFALQAKKPVILLTEMEKAEEFFQKIGGNLVNSANSAEEAIELTKKLLKEK